MHYLDFNLCKDKSKGMKIDKNIYRKNIYIYIDILVSILCYFFAFSYAFAQINIEAVHAPLWTALEAVHVPLQRETLI